MKHSILCLLLAAQSVVLFSACGNQKQKNADQATVTDTLSATPGEPIVAPQEAKEMIRKFYSELLVSKPATEQVLTQGLIEKIVRMRTRIDADPVIRAQDTCEGSMPTLQVEHLEGNWYMVSYACSQGVPAEEHTKIPLKVISIDGRCMISYITPTWHETLYGDSLLCTLEEVPAIVHTSPLDFLKSFYEAYTTTYAAMPEGLAARLSALRTEHLTPNALKQYAAAEKEAQMADDGDGYDLLINDFDFDTLWLPLLKIEQKAGQESYQMSLSGATSAEHITLKIIKQGDKYVIDSVAISR